jgi:hypothetical protein
MSPKFLNRSGMGRGQSSPITSSGTRAAAAAPSSGPVSQFRGEFGNAMSGRVSLLFLNSMILMLVLFYLWTRNAQGGG